MPKKVTSFSVDLLKKLTREKQDENLLFSPLSAYAALMMLDLGAGEKTRKELGHVLKMDNEMNHTNSHKEFSKILKKIQHKPESSEDQMPETIVANGFFVQKGHPIHDSYLQSLQEYYNTTATNVDFLKHAGEATETINSFISESTKKRIEKFYETPLPSTTVAVLTSALYFNGHWQNPFNKDHTEMEKFHIGNTEFDVHMMRNQKVISYSYSDTLQFECIELQYKGEEFSMWIFLPRPTQTIKNMTEHMHMYDAHEVQRNTKVVGVDYKIPRMKFSWKNSLVNALALDDVFRSTDLSQMTAEKLPVSDMVQATEIEVDEVGTVATAATAISHTRLLSPPANMKVKFYVDRPFIINIFHRPTSMMLFQGTVYKPQQ